MLPEKHFIKKYSFVITIFQALQMFIALFCYVFTHFKLGYDFDYFGFTMYSIYAILFCKLLNNKVSVKSKNNEIKEE
jgi:hypothetical protein